MSEETCGTCDWGYCDGEAVAERLDPKSGSWLAVCRKCSGSGPDRQQSTRRAHCVDCCGEYVVNVDGRMRLHSSGYARCPGSGREIPVVGAE
jgi:hypothetical protein